MSVRPFHRLLLPGEVPFSFLATILSKDDEKENDEDTSTVASQDELQEKDVGSTAGECSRTMGHPVKQSRSVKQPFKPPPPPEEKSPFKEVASTSTAASPVQNFLSKTLHKHINATTSGGTGSRSATDMTKFSLKIAARHTFQYARWDVLKEKFINGDIDIFFHVRPGKLVKKLVSLLTYKAHE